MNSALSCGGESEFFALRGALSTARISRAFQRRYLKTLAGGEK
jgi:hypothetical protein